MTQATDIVKQIQEALKYYADQDFAGDTIDVGSCGVASTYDSETVSLEAEKALKLIPSLIADLERVEKGVSLEDCAKSLFEESTGRVGQWNNLHPAIRESYVDGAKAVLDKAGVKYHD